VAKGFQKLTVTAIPVGLSPPDSTNHALVSTENAPIRFRTDGADPDATTGHLTPVGSRITLESGREIRQFSAISVGSGDAILQVSYDSYSQIGR
jgi:hypothetical protein